MFHSNLYSLLRLSFVAWILPVNEGVAAESVIIDGRQWTPESNGKSVRWPEADQFCDSLELEGHNDWVVPSISQLASLHDPSQPSGIIEEIHIESCCVWSSTTLMERPGEGSDGLQLKRYRWGFMYDGGLEYYAIQFFDDGEVLCTRN